MTEWLRSEHGASHCLLLPPVPCIPGTPCKQLCTIHPYTQNGRTERQDRWCARQCEVISFEYPYNRALLTWMVSTEIRLIIVSAAKDGEVLYSQQKQDWELLVAKFRLKLKKVGKTTKPFRYDLNQISYNYTQEFGNQQCQTLPREQVPDAFRLLVSFLFSSLPREDED